MYHLSSKGEESEQEDDTRRTSQKNSSWVQESKEKINQNQFLATTT